MRIADINLGQIVNMGSISDILGKLNAGDIVRAQVIEFTANELLLKLFDGTTVKASSMAPIDVKKGEFVDFRVKNKTESQLFIETLKNSEDGFGAKNDIALKLSAIDIKADPKNVEIANALKSNDIPLNKEIFTKVADYIKAFKGLSPQKAAFLTANNIGISQNNIEVLSNIVDGRMKIGQNLSDLLSSLDGIEDSALLEKLEKSIEGINAAKSGNDAKDAVSKHLNNFSGAEKAGDAFNKNAGLDANHINSGSSEIKTLQDFLGKNLSSADKINLKDLINLLERGAADKTLDRGLAEKIISRLKTESDSPENLLPKDRNGIERLLKNTLTAKAETYLDKLNGGRDTGKPEGHEKLSQIKKALEDIFIKLDSKQIDKDINIKSVYKEMYEKLEAIKEGLRGSNSPTGESLSNKIDNIQSGIRFLNDINSHSNYVQIPINIMDKKTNGELYILKRDSKRKKIDPENVTMYISLDTCNIGKVDSLLSLTKKSISVNMRVEDERVREFIKESHSELYKRLDDIGYKLVDLKCRIISEDVNLLNVNDVVNKELAGSKVSIDCKI